MFGQLLFVNDLQCRFFVCYFILNQEYDPKRSIPKQVPHTKHFVELSERLSLQLGIEWDSWTGVGVLPFVVALDF